ncbi:MAG TPA: hypothetical protein VHU89_03770 [Acidobacteriaceae bacterium]|nr:hypothetical protein [Acidobacteriaceae bacterium]
MRCCALCFVFGLLSAALAVPSSAQAQATSSAASTASVAHVYVQTKSGVDVLNANAAGQLTEVSGSPFPDSGEMEAVRGNTLLISVGTNDLHSYALSSDGAVGRQLAQIDTANYGGSQCGNTDNSGSILDHTGQYFSVQLYGTLTNDGNNYLCDAWQTYKVAANGEFTFLGDWVNSSTSGPFAYELSPLDLNMMTVSSNDKYTYGKVTDPDGDSFVPFTRAESGEVTLNSDFMETGPTPESGSTPYVPLAVAADPSGHLAAVMQGSKNTQLASYTINNSTGSIQSTNTWKNMPVIKNTGYPLVMSPAGNLVALGSLGAAGGVGVFHFNGAAPPTYYTTLLPSVEIDQLAWDKSNHLYALSYVTDRLYVYTITTTSVKPVAGSPYTVPGAEQGAWGLTGFVVVPQ